MTCVIISMIEEEEGKRKRKNDRDERCKGEAKPLPCTFMYKVV